MFHPALPFFVCTCVHVYICTCVYVYMCTCKCTLHHMVHLPVCILLPLWHLLITNGTEVVVVAVVDECH